MLTLQNTEAIRRIEEAIGYTFNDKRLLIQVLTRKTYLKIDPEAPDNEVLEFYGDTLMNYHVTNYFMSKYAHMLDDGLFFMRTVEQFTDMRSHYVCNRYLTDRIKAMGLARYLRAQNRDSELRRDGEKAYADIFESLVGAIYLDSYQNDTLIRAFILRQLGIEPKRLPADIEAFDYDSLTAPIVAEPAPTALEEPETIVDLPTEKETDVQADPVEEVPVWAELVPTAEEEVPEEAETEAVAVVDKVHEEAPVEESHAEETVLSAPAAALPIPVPEAPVTAVTVIQTKQEALADFCRQWGYDQPTYGQTPPNAPNARPVAACTMKYKDAKGKLVKISLNDSGKTLAEATEKAAAKMLKKLEKQIADTLSKETKKDEKPAPARTAEAMVEQSDTPSPEVRESEQSAPVAEVVAVPENPTVEPVVETVEAAESTEVSETAPTEANPIEKQEPVEILPEESVDAVPAESDAHAVEPEAVAETEALTVNDPAPVDETVPAVPDAPIAESAPVEEFIQQTMVLNVESPAEATPTEDAKPAKAPRKKKAESADGADKPAKKASSKKKSSPKEDKPAEDAPVTEVLAEEAAESASEVPAKESKPRTRKPRAKKQDEVSEIPAEDGQAE